MEGKSVKLVWLDHTLLSSSLIGGYMGISMMEMTAIMLGFF